MQVSNYKVYSVVLLPMENPAQVYLLLGTNIGSRFANLQIACAHLQKRIGNIKKRSPVYNTKPWGLSDQPDFLNQALMIETTLSPEKLLDALQEIEQEMGMHKERKWGERLIDLDILFYNDDIVESERLQIPHALMSERRFVLMPLNDIASGLLHPVLNQKISQLLKSCKDPLQVMIVEKDAV